MTAVVRFVTQFQLKTKTIQPGVNSLTEFGEKRRFDASIEVVRVELLW